ncbi:hypothetical protein ABEF95_001646 [Exophiala dermatitidis]
MQRQNTPFDTHLFQSTNPIAKDTHNYYPDQHILYLPTTTMVQYDPFATFMSALPAEEKAAAAAAAAASFTPPESPKSLHPQLRRLSSCHGHNAPYCTKCHMRRPSQEHLVNTRSRSHSHSPDEESWDGFCPDIHMPDHHTPTRPMHHTRRHSGLCPQDLISAEAHHSSGRTSPHTYTQMTIKARPSCHHQHHPAGYHHDCHCERVTPVENLSERYGLVEEPEDMLEAAAAHEVAEIMHEELVADMEARQL